MDLQQFIDAYDRITAHGWLTFDEAANVAKPHLEDRK